MKKECKDCKHCVQYISALNQTIMQFDKCTNTKTTNEYKYCSTQRNMGWLLGFMSGACGKRGRYWEKK